MICEVRKRLGHISLGAVALTAFAVVVIAMGAPLWLEIVALLLGGAVWFRYRWNTGIREEYQAVVERGLAKGLAKREERQARKRSRHR